MSKPRDPWWGYCRNMVRRYPVWVARYNALHGARMTADYTGVPRSGVTGRPTEEVAARELTQTEQHSLDAVEKAIRATRRRTDGRERLRLIALVYWPRRYDKAMLLREAADRVHISEITAKRWHRDFILTVARFRGLLD